MSLSVRAEADHTFRFPRVSGDEPMVSVTVRAMAVFSPRERG